jgi:hypothetical protein
MESASMGTTAVEFEFRIADFPNQFQNSMVNNRNPP